ncbi:unnamed protein product [Sphagnum troendelagicum]|uniref:Cytochrome P450 n=1 Tax=Sphagnum troendelagicum TaxID=128251 RepID=A0ABP0UUY4_9BRYO
MIAGLELEHPPTGRRLQSLQEKDGLFIALSLTLLALVAHFVFYRRFRHLPPGPWPWPVVGNLFLLGSSPHQAFAHLAKKYRPLVYLRLGSRHTVIVSSPAMAKEFLLTHDRVFQYRRLSTVNKILNNGTNIGQSSGPLWRQLHEKGEKEAHHLKQIVDDIFGAFATVIIGDYVPSLWWVSKLQGVEAPLHELRKRMKQFAQGILDEHRRDNATTDHQDSTYNDKPKDFIDDLLAGGTDTTSVTLEWAMAELLRNPKLMKRAQDELDTIVGTDRVVEESDLQHLPYLQAIMKETFRFHPAAPFTIPHMSLESCQVAGYYLPPKTCVMVNLWAMGRNPDVWERPLEFDPERFLEHPEIDWNGHSFELLPFSSGRRACPGQPLAELVIQLALAHLVHSFNWSLTNQQEPQTLDMSDKFGLSLPRAQPLHAMAHPRLPTHLY